MSCGCNKKNIAGVKDVGEAVKAMMSNRFAKDLSDSNDIDTDDEFDPGSPSLKQRLHIKGDNTSNYTVCVQINEQGHPLSCGTCYEKHLATAAILSTEYAEDNSRSMERALARGHLTCAAQHAYALDRKEDAAKIVNTSPTDVDAIYKLLPESFESKDLAVGELSSAEFHLRYLGMHELADVVRSVRLVVSSNDSNDLTDFDSNDFDSNE